MARNKHPEETVKKILDVATRLFLEQGYDGTSMQDIVRALGMSKGAVYHHFRSKEELFEKAVLQYYAREDWFREIAENVSLSGLEKLQALFLHEMSDKEKLSVDRLYFTQINDPRIFMEHMRLNITESAPSLAQIIEEGNRDGSLQVEQPLEAAELALLMANVWIGVFAETKEKFNRQLSLCRKVLESIGLPLFNDMLLAKMRDYYDCTISWAGTKISAAFDQNAE